MKETLVVFWMKLNVFWMFCGEEVKMKVMDEEEDVKEVGLLENAHVPGFEPSTSVVEVKCANQ